MPSEKQSEAKMKKARLMMDERPRFFLSVSPLCCSSLQAPLLCLSVHMTPLSFSFPFPPRFVFPFVFALIHGCVSYLFFLPRVSVALLLYPSACNFHLSWAGLGSSGHLVPLCSPCPARSNPFALPSTSFLNLRGQFQC